MGTTMIRFCGIVAMLFIIGVKAKVEKVCAEVSAASGSSVEIEVDIVMGNGKKYRYDVTSNTVCLNINEDMKDSRIAYLAVQDIYPSTDDVINSFYIISVNARRVIPASMVLRVFYFQTISRIRTVTTRVA